MSSQRGRGGRRAQTTPGERRPPSGSPGPVSAVVGPPVVGLRASRALAPVSAVVGPAVVGPSASGTVEERDRNRHLLKDLVISEKSMEQKLDNLARMSQEFQRESQWLSDTMGTAKAEMSEMRKELDLAYQDIKQNQGELLIQKQLMGKEMADLQQLKTEMTQSIGKLKQQMYSNDANDQKVAMKMQQLKQEVDSTKQQQQEQVQQLKQTQEVHLKQVDSMKQQHQEDVQQLRQKQEVRHENFHKKFIILEKKNAEAEKQILYFLNNGDGEKQIKQLRQDLDALKKDGEAKPHGQTRRELAELRKQLTDSGVLKMEREDVPEGEDPPVGILDLPEDIYSARLLLTLGFLGKRLKEHKENEDQNHGPHSSRILHVLHHEQTDDSDQDDEDSSLQRFQGLQERYDNLGGVVLPEIDEGPSWAYWELTKGIVAIKITTMAVQLIILLVMVKSYMNGKTCTETPLTPADMKWWLLHLSRSLAVLVAGALTINQILAVMNYAMLAVLVTGITLESVVTITFRLLLNVLTIVGSLYMFFSSTNPAETWMNMTALGFIAGLSADILGLARGGVFGPHISAGVNDLNFSLDIRHDYPWWYAPTRHLTLLLCISLIICFAAYTFHKDDPICPGVLYDIENHQKHNHVHHEGGSHAHHKR